MFALVLWDFHVGEDGGLVYSVVTVASRCCSFAVIPVNCGEVTAEG